ncbi:glucosylceramidase [Acrasis kona]|uniref:Glucosylceramidase n=1 Tax=Acrasis kona TaxID=1008807 RepID=A0AAW2ZSE4_9EUKA
MKIIHTLLIVVLIASAAWCQIEVYETQKETSLRITRGRDLQWSSNDRTANAVLTVDVDSNKQYQPIIGWGGAFTEASAHVFKQLNPQVQDEVMEAYFGPNGLNYTLCRTHMNSCDFSLENYSCDNTTGDFALENFNINRDLRYIVPLIKLAQRKKPSLKWFFTPWSPPAWMKGNGKMDETSKPGLIWKDQYKKTWALFFHKFIQAYKKQGIEFWGVTVQNEPEAITSWDTCYYSKEEERDFVRDYLGPLLRQNYPDLKIMIWDHNRDNIFEWAKTILGDEETAKYVDGTAFHWYVDNLYENVQKTYETYPNKFVLASEACHCPGVKLYDYERGELYARDIIHDLNAGSGGWIDWNILLDSVGGPNHVGNFCDAPLVKDKDQQKIHYQFTYYHLGHFTKFMQVDGKRIFSKVSDRTDKVYSAAVLNPDGRVSLVIQNMSDEDFDVKIQDGSRTAVATIAAHSIKTFRYQK